MGDAVVVIPTPSPPPSPPQTAWRNIAMVQARSRVGLTAAAAAMYLLLAIMWLLFASLAALRIKGIACGEDCPVAAAAPKAMAVGLVSFWLVLPVAAAAWLISKTAFNTHVEELITPAEQQMVYAVKLGMLAIVAFLLLGFAGVLLKGYSSVEGSHRDIVSSVIIDVASLGSAVLYCFIILPALALYVWKMILVLRQRI
ncbi:hypothetical protein SETIT_6G148200v2 [Setaria italica]|uniref:Uncharacterized protein n=1 Tax=Setaria italica TaxID=4555 RepID=A0A368RLV4_SETIT|nr:hypothetical protein SETIT_6G148200v2 [Setaria italica]